MEFLIYKNHRKFHRELTWLYFGYYAIFWSVSKDRQFFKVHVCYVQKPPVHLNLASCGALGRGKKIPKLLKIQFANRFNRVVRLGIPHTALSKRKSFLYTSKVIGIKLEFYFKFWPKMIWPRNGLRIMTRAGCGLQLYEKRNAIV